MESIKCWKCDNLSTITVQASGHFCNGCFVEYFTKKYHRIIGSARLIKNGDVVVFGFNGSKAGSAMLDILKLFDLQFRSKEKSLKRKIQYKIKILHLDIDNARYVGKFINRIKFK